MELLFIDESEQVKKEQKGTLKDVLGSSGDDIVQKPELVATALQNFGKEYIIGNIKDEGFSLINLWRNSAKLDEIRQMSKRIQERCKSCEDYEENCKGTSLEMELFRQKNGHNPYCREDKR